MKDATIFILNDTVDSHDDISEHFVIFVFDDEFQYDLFISRSIVYSLGLQISLGC